ncbi:hypothetical protein OJAV_G00020200 [Oryzias javanicus]|uniref:Uncharacterized protein n=1 Tax=Oryzias javanicus TaxID=123683 RepID=A0A437DHK4_ORYJA|nr:hypothetical protein OJAV_G00020200 [Oryzias javanicus]
MPTWGHRAVRPNLGAFPASDRTKRRSHRASKGTIQEKKKWRNRGEETPLSIYGGGCKSRIGSRVLVDTFERVQKRRRHGGDKVGSAGADPSTGRSVRRGRALSAAILRTLGRGWR